MAYSQQLEYKLCRSDIWCDGDLVFSPSPLEPCDCFEVKKAKKQIRTVSSQVRARFQQLNAELMAAKKQGMTHKVWVIAGGSKVRPGHTKMERVKVPIDEPFSMKDSRGNPFKLRLPSDPTVPLELTANCRCTVRYSPSGHKCEAFRRDMIDANRSKWHADVDREILVMRIEHAKKVIGEKFDKDLWGVVFNLLGGLIVAGVKANVAEALLEMYKAIHIIYAINENLARELEITLMPLLREYDATLKNYREAEDHIRQLDEELYRSACPTYGAKMKNRSTYARGLRKLF